MLAAFFFSFDYADIAVIVPRLTHIGAGTVALFAGLVPMLGRKGALAHRRAGRVYVGAMIVVAITALVLTALLPLTGGRLFLTGIAVFSFYLSFSGWRAARRHTPKLAPADTVLAFFTLLTGLVMIGAGIYWKAILFAFFGSLTSIFAQQDVRAALRAVPADKPEPWIFRHIARMGGSYIATFTAFLVVNLGRWLPDSAPAWLNTVGWIAPSLLGSLLIRQAIRGYKAKPKEVKASVRPQPMRSLLVLICALPLTWPVMAQAPESRELRGLLRDEAGAPLAYATVGVVGQPIGTVADAAGRFQLKLPITVERSDSVRFGLLGYRPRTWAVAALPANPVDVTLAEAPTMLPEAAVRARGLDTARIGNPHYQTHLITNFALSKQPGQNVGAEIGRVFQLPRRGAWLESFRCVVCSTFDTVRLRLNVYRLRDGIPAEPLLIRPLYRELIDARDRWVTFDLRAENLFVTEGEVAVTVEWVGHSRQQESLGIPLLMPAFATHLYRYGAANRWKRFPGMSTTMELTVLK